MDVNFARDDLAKKLAAFKADPLTLSKEAILDLWAPAREAAQAVDTAMAAFDSDLKRRRDALDQQAAALDVQIADLKTQVQQLESSSRDSASLGDLDAAAEADEQAEGLRKQLSVVQRKRRIAASSELKGDPALFQQIEDARKEFTEVRESCEKAVREASGLVKELHAHFKKLEDVTWKSYDYGPFYNDRQRNRIEHTFHADFYRQLAEKEKADRERAEQERQVTVIC